MSFVNCSYPTIFMQNTGEKYVNGTKKNANSKKSVHVLQNFSVESSDKIKKSWKEHFYSGSIISVTKTPGSFCRLIYPSYFSTTRLIRFSPCP